MAYPVSPAKDSLDSMLEYCHKTSDTDLSAKKCLFKELAFERYQAGESVNIVNKHSTWDYASLTTTEIVVGCGKVDRMECTFEALGQSLKQLGQSTELEMENDNNI